MCSLSCVWVCARCENAASYHSHLTLLLCLAPARLVPRATVRRPNAPTSAPQPSPIKMLRSSVVSSFRSRPSAASLASHGASSRAPTVTVTSATTHELDWPMLMPFKRLLAAFVVLLLTYYWCQVWPRVYRVRSVLLCGLS